MKYMTKNWYDAIQKINLHRLLKIDKRANKFSEDLYQELYVKEKEQYLKILGATEEVEELIKKYEHSNNISKAEQEKIIENIKNVKDYRRLVEHRINELKKKLPIDILSDIKDIRILALNYTTEDIYNRIKLYSEKMQEYVEKMCRDYQKLEDEQFKDNKPEFITENFHDCDIEKSEIIDNNLILRLNNTGGFTNVNTLTFKNIEIIKQEGNLDNYWWLYNELYKNGNKYEVHILLCDENHELKDLILICDNIILKK